MRRTLIVLALIVGLAFADEELYKGAKVKTLASAPKAEAKKDDVKKVVQPQAQERQDTYGAPAAPAVDTYGSPAAPVQDSYGSPQAAPVAAAPVQGEVGTQGYYYYYYPVANSYSPTQTYQSSSASSSSSGGGLGGGLGLAILVGGGILIVIALLAAVFANGGTTTGRSLFENVDTDDLVYQVYNAIELWNQLS